MYGKIVDCDWSRNLTRLIHLCLINLNFIKFTLYTKNDKLQLIQFFNNCRKIFYWSIFRIWVDFRLKPIFNTALAASKNTARFKSGQIWLKNNQFTSLIYIRDTLCSIVNFH